MNEKNIFEQNENLGWLLAVYLSCWRLVALSRKVCQRRTSTFAARRFAGAAGIIWPRALVLPNKAWMLLAEGLSYVTTRVILALGVFPDRDANRGGQKTVRLGPAQPPERQQRILLEALLRKTARPASLREDVLSAGFTGR